MELNLRGLIILSNFGKLGVHSLANANRARQFNPLNPPGWVPLPQTNMTAVVGRSCVVVRAWSCAVVCAWSVIRGRAWSFVVGHSWSCMVVRGRARFAASTAVARTNEHLITH